MQLVFDPQGKLPGWIRLPKSAALPFGSFEAALDAAPDGDAARRVIAAADADASAANLAAVRCVASFVTVHYEAPRMHEPGVIWLKTAGTWLLTVARLLSRLLKQSLPEWRRSAGLKTHAACLQSGSDGLGASATAGGRAGGRLRVAGSHAG